MSARNEPYGCPYSVMNYGLDLFAHILCVSVPSSMPSNSNTPIEGAVRLSMMSLRDGENGLTGRRFRTYRRGLGHLKCPYRITLRIDPITPSNLSRSIQRVAWFEERVSWCGEEIEKGWSMFTPARYEDTDCRFEFCFEDEKEAVLFGLRWKGE